MRQLKPKKKHHYPELWLNTSGHLSICHPCGKDETYYNCSQQWEDDTAINPKGRDYYLNHSFLIWEFIGEIK